MIFTKSFLTELLHDSFNFIYTYLNESGKFPESYSYLKIIVFPLKFLHEIFHNSQFKKYN